ncbi:rab-GTPase-TBC domain-containing protein, partial [Endogone sp. FLAS-F59071]
SHSPFVHVEPNRRLFLDNTLQHLLLLLFGIATRSKTTILYSWVTRNRKTSTLHWLVEFTPEHRSNTGNIEWLKVSKQNSPGSWLSSISSPTIIKITSSMAGMLSSSLPAMLGYSQRYARTSRPRLVAVGHSSPLRSGFLEQGTARFPPFACSTAILLASPCYEIPGKATSVPTSLRSSLTGDPFPLLLPCPRPSRSSVKPVPSRSTSPRDGPLVVGAQYSYATIVTAAVNPNLLSPHMIPNSSPPTLSASNSFNTNNLAPYRHPSPRRSTSSLSNSSLPPVKAFSDFLHETNDEWDDGLKEEEDDEEEREEENESRRNQSPAARSYARRVHAKKKAELERAAREAKGEIVARNPNGVKNRIEGLMQDPSNMLNDIALPQPDPTKHTEAEILKMNARIARIAKFKDALQSPNVDLVALRKLSWSGIPEELRPMAWQLLLGYLPCNSDRRVATLARKRKEYEDGVSAAYARGIAGLDQALWHQIHIDVPRTNPGIPLYQYDATQQCLERILYCWAIRHPASGYVQGINDLVTPFFQVFLSAYIDDDPETYDPSVLPKEVLAVVEADSFWCLSKLLDGIQDNYTFAQPGIQRQIVTLKELICRIDAPLAAHLQSESIEFIQFAFRWMNCLLMRELSLENTIRMWDTYLAEGPDGFSEFHVYVCAAFLVKWSDQLKKLDFQGIMMFLQQLPTQAWEAKDIELLLSEAYMWKSLFHNAPSHLVRS